MRSFFYELFLFGIYIDGILCSICFDRILFSICGNAKLTILCHVEKGDCIRTDMAACAIIIRGIDKITHLDTLPDLLHDIKRIFIRISVGNSYDLVFRFHDRIADQIDQCIQGCFSAAAFLELYDITVFIAAQDRFDL